MMFLASSSSNSRWHSRVVDVPRLRVLVLLTMLASLVALSPATPSAAQTITPDEALLAAARGNPGLRAALANTAAARADAAAEDEARGAVVTASVDGNYTERLGATSAGVIRNESQGVAAGVGVGLTTDAGTRLEAAARTDVNWTSVNINPSTTASVTFGPVYSTTLSVTATQPLLRGAGRDATLAARDRAEALFEQSQHERDDSASQIARDVLIAYWELWYADRAVEVQRASLAVSTQQYEDMRTRAETLRTAARTDALRLLAEQSTIEEGVAQAIQTRLARAIELGRLMGVAPGEAATLQTTRDAPSESALPSVEEALERAMADSTALRALYAQVAVARRSVEARADASLTRLDVTASLAMTGVWTEDGLPRAQLPGSRPAFAATVGLDLELPVGGGRAVGDLASARAQLAAVEARYDAQAQAIAAEVATLHGDAAAAMNRAQLAARSTEVNRSLAEAERERLRLGTVAPLSLVEAQQRERESMLRQLRALVDRESIVLRLGHHLGALAARVDVGAAP